MNSSHLQTPNRFQKSSGRVIALKRVVPSMKPAGHQAMEQVMNVKRATDRCTFNLFSWKEGPDLCCAVPDHLPVPTFIDDDWRYEGTLCGDSRQPRGFDPAAAEVGTRLFGFHLFQAAGLKAGSARAGCSELGHVAPAQAKGQVTGSQMKLNGAQICKSTGSSGADVRGTLGTSDGPALNARRASARGAFSTKRKVPVAMPAPARRVSAHPTIRLVGSLLRPPCDFEEA
jgi:hypothetical protein